MIQLAELKAHLGTAAVETDPDADTVLVSLEERAVSFVERETRRHFGPSEPHVEHLEGTGTPRLWLRENPSSITSIEYRSSIGGDWTEIEEIADDGWELRQDRVLRKSGAFWDRDFEFRVTYDFGYASGSEPAEIRGLVIDLVAMRWRQRGLEGQGSGKIGDYGYAVSDIEAIPGARDIFRRWRRPEVN